MTGVPALSWERVRGHDPLIEAFDGAVRRDRLAHAYLFVGPPGVGKRLFAGELAKALLCEARPTDGLEACDRCSSCLLMDAGTHPDFIAAARPEDSLEFPIATVREVCRALSLKSARGRSKVAVIDDADDLNEEAANCFLKTLEEPPAGSVLLLVGTSPDRQLPTILSRCQVIHFAPLPDALVSGLLQAQGVEDEALRQRLVRLGRGSPGAALALADPALWEFRRKFLEALASPRADPVAVATVWTQFVEEAGKEAACQRQRAALVLRLLVEFLRDALAFSAGGATRSTAPDERRWVEELAGRVGAERLLLALDRCLEAGLQIERRVQLVLILEALIDALVRRVAVPG